MVGPDVINGDYALTDEIEFDRSFVDRNLGDEIFRELAQRSGDDVYPCYEILVSRATGRKIRMPAMEVKHLTINWKLYGL